MTSNNLPQVVKFNNQDVPVFFHENKPYVAMKSICENIGLDWEAQRQRIKRNHALSQGACMIKAPSKGGEQEVLTLPIGYLNGWLFGIDVNRVKPEIKDTLIKYQLECYDVLYKHFMSKVAEIHPNTITAEQQQAIKDAVLRKAQRDKRTYQSIYHEFYNVFDIPRYQELPLSRFDEALKWLGDGWYQHKAPTQNVSNEPYELVRKLTEAILAQNGAMNNVWKALELVAPNDFIYFHQYIMESNVLARKVSIGFDFKTKCGTPLVDQYCRTINFSTGARMGVNPKWFNAPAW